MGVLKIYDHRPEHVRAAPISNPGPPPVSLKDKGINVLKSANAIARSGFKFASPEVQSERYEICKLCPQWKADSNVGFGECKRCGCTRVKLMFEAMSCPDGKWKAI